MLKLIKAIVRLELVEEVVAALRREGVPRVTISHVCAVGSGADPEELKFSMELGCGYTEKALIQFVCPSERIDELITVVTQHAHTGRQGDGIVFVTPVDRAVKIRSGVEGAAALN